ncbi:PAS domain-containing sensor histidine kinase [Actinomadura sp. B10D3]|uniref:sensor histidine kinase n=1 Tax=Actinomadura sp. B10D3 TaxID=3153557 RepID=UPI00325D4469
MLTLGAARTVQAVWGVLALLRVIVHFIGSHLARRTALSIAHRLLRLPNPTAVRPATAADLVSLAADLRRILRADLLQLDTALPSGPVSVEASRAGIAPIDRRPAGPRDSGRPVRVSRHDLPDGWRAAVQISLCAPDGRDAGRLLLGWTGSNGRYAARRATGREMSEALTSAGRVLDGFWADAWEAHGLERERSRLSALVEHCGVALLAIRPPGRVIAWNAAMADMTGLQAADAIGRRTEELFVLTAEDGTMTSLADGSPGTVQMTTATGRSLRVEFSCSPVMSDAVSEFQTVVVVDVSARWHLDRMRQLAVATAHHELHGPLTMIHGHVQLLDPTLAGETERDSLTAIHDAVEMMYHVITDLVLLSETDPSARLATNEPIDVAAVLRRTLLGVPSVAARTVIDSQSGITVYGDPVRLRQCLLLVLGNAEKYAPDGKITITARRDGAYGVIGIADEGPGIPPGERDLALRPYYRSAAFQDLPGTGIGLHIVQEMISVMHGRIDLAATPSGGLQVTLHLPLTPWDEMESSQPP